MKLTIKSIARELGINTEEAAARMSDISHSGDDQYSLTDVLSVFSSGIELPAPPLKGKAFRLAQEIDKAYTQLAGDRAQYISSELADALTAAVTDKAPAIATEALTSTLKQHPAPSKVDLGESIRKAVATLQPPSRESV